MPTSSLDVARYFVHLASSEEEPDSLTNLRVQKLVYYVQGWSLAVFGKPFFQDRIEAWTNGPVAPDLYHEFKEYGYRPIPDTVAAEGSLTETEKELVKSVWCCYRVHSASGLRERTHTERPWVQARGGTSSNVRSNAEITHASLREYFSEQLARNAPQELPPARAYEALASVEQGKLSSHEDVFKRLRDRACPTT